MFPRATSYTSALLVLFFASYALRPTAADFRSPHVASYAIAAALFAACYQATALPRLVERPTIRLGDRLRRRMRPPAALIPGASGAEA